MGVDVYTVVPVTDQDEPWSIVGTHTAHFGYDTFQRVLERLAEAEGIELAAMQGYRYLAADLVHARQGIAWDGTATVLLPLFKALQPDVQNGPDWMGEVAVAPQLAGQVLERVREIADATDWEQVTGLGTTGAQAVEQLVGVLADSARNGWHMLVTY